MKSQKSKLFRLAASGFAAVAMLQSSQAATTLTFDTGGENGSGIPSSYGDNLLGTPNISLNFVEPANVWDSYPDWDGRGAVGQTDYNTSNNPNIGNVNLTFTSNISSVGIIITSFDLDEYAGGGDSVVNWSILSESGTIVSGIWNPFNTANDASDLGGRTTVNTGMSLAQAQANAGSTITLNLNLASGSGGYQAIDNLSFDQVVVPEPSVSLLALLGLGALASRRRRI